MKILSRPRRPRVENPTVAASGPRKSPADGELTGSFVRGQELDGMSEPVGPSVPLQTGNSNLCRSAVASPTFEARYVQAHARRSAGVRRP